MIDMDYADDDESSTPEREPEPEPVTTKKKFRRASVSAESDVAGTSKKLSNFSITVVAKSDEQKERLRKAMASNFWLAAIPESQRELLIGAMAEVKVTAGTSVITQGEVGDFFYVIDHGSFDVYKTESKESAPMKVFTYENAGSFGELALMYNSPRAATVTARTDGSVWALERALFTTIVVQHARKTKERYEKFLEKVPIIEHLSRNELSQVADSLVSQEFKDGDVIIRQGDSGDSFYIVESGEVVCHRKNFGQAEPVLVKKIGPGGYFGERALILRDTRAATVSASGGGATKVLKMENAAFNRLLGDASLIMQRGFQEYESYTASTQTV